MTSGLAPDSSSYSLPPLSRYDSLFLDNNDVVNGCRLLALRLYEVLDNQTAADDCIFLGIPRGGLIVLGYLSYLMRLSHDQLLAGDAGAEWSKRNPGRTVVIVDDCAFTGYRFNGYLERLHHEISVVFATLCAPAALNEAIVAQESHVTHCVTAFELTEVATATDEFKRKFEGTRYWLGCTEMPVFPWSEPEFRYWDPNEGQLVDEWRFHPPHLVAENHFGLPPMPRSKKDAAFTANENVIYRDTGDALFLYQRAHDRLYRLTDVAADIWKTLVTYGEIPKTIKYLISKYDVDEKTTATDVNNITAMMLEAGLLTKSVA